jgi:5-(carboxyamino)imidazole ribonucleotide synthase
MNKVGIIGGGQLAGMMAEAAAALNVQLIVQTPSPNDPAVAIAEHVIYAPVHDAIATEELARHCQVITFENEFIDRPALEALAAQGACFRPSLAALAPLLDKLDQRNYLTTLGLPSPAFTPWDLGDPIPEDFPCVVKTRRHGYDGQGTAILHHCDQWQSLSDRFLSVPLLIEAFVPFERELAVMAARGTTGEVQIYPVVETIQAQQVCRRVIAPAPLTAEMSDRIHQMARCLLEALQYVGILGIEFFQTSTGEVLINEIAPRTHNSGHYSLDACPTSQFEMQLRAILGLPLGSSQLKTAGAVMVNLLGYEQSDSDYLSQRTQLAAIPQAHLHWYGKTEARPGRKLGHVTVLIDEPADLAPDRIQRTIQAIEQLWYPTP